MDTALPHKFPFTLDRNLANANWTGNWVCTSCDTVVLGCDRKKMSLCFVILSDSNCFILIWLFLQWFSVVEWNYKTYASHCIAPFSLFSRTLLVLRWKNLRSTAPWSPPLRCTPRRTRGCPPATWRTSQSSSTARPPTPSASSGSTRRRTTSSSPSFFMASCWTWWALSASSETSSQSWS